MFNRLKQRYQAWQERRFLKRHGCTSRAQYERIYDPDHNAWADRTQDYYHGYPYVHCFEDYRHYIYQMLADYGPGGRIYGHSEVDKWARENCLDKVRFDFLRVHKQGAIGWDGSVTEEWCINEISGSDLIFVGFKDERDYIFFKLRWA